MEWGEREVRLFYIYLASPFPNQSMYLDLKERIEATGFDCPYRVCSRWLREETPPGFDRQAPEFFPYLAARAVIAFEDVQKCNLLVADMEGILQAGRPRHGTHVEIGMALAWKKQIWIVGERNNCFHHHPQIQHFEDWDAVIHQLDGWTQG